MFNTNNVTVTTQDQFTEDVNRQLRTVSICPVLNLFIPGLIALKYVLDVDGKKGAGPTACTDGYFVYVSPDYWNSCSGPQKIGLMFHEMLHCLWLHFFRFSGCLHWLANMACDVVVNRFIRQLAQSTKHIELPPNPPQGKIIDTDEFKDESEETIYNKLAQRLDEEEPEGGGGSGGDSGDSEDTEDDSSGGGGSGDEDGDDGESGGGGGSGGDSESDSESGGGGGSGEGEEDGEGDGSGSGGSGGQTPTSEEERLDPKKSQYNGPGDFMPPPANPPQDTEEGEGDGDGEGSKPKGPMGKLQELRDKWEDCKQVIAQTARLRGDMPAGLIEMLDKGKPQIDWQSILQRFILNCSVVDVSEDTFDRRFMTGGLYVEAIDRPSVSDIIFAKDTSGSMYTKWLAQSCTEIQYAMQQVKIQRCWVLDIDASLEGEIKEYGPMDTIDFSARGRGGTDFRPPFVWAQEHCPNPPACLIYFTDGYGPFPEEPPPFPVLWMTFGLEPEKYPFGTVIDMRQLVS